MTHRPASVPPALPYPDLPACFSTRGVKSSHDSLSTAASLLPLDLFQPAFGRTTLARAVVGGALLVAPPAFAQDPDRTPESAHTFEAVVVSGEQDGDDGYQPPARGSNSKFTAPLLETPKSVTIIPETLIEDRAATSLQDVLRTTPGITLGAGEGGTPNGDRPFVRGYEASTDILIDGVRDYARGSHETFNLESVELIRGPSSAYSGRGGTGGSINLVTKKPHLGLSAEMSAGYGTDDQWRTTFDGNLPFSNTGALRLNLMRMGGEVAGRDGVSIDRWGVAPSLAFGLGTPTRFTLSYAQLENDDMPDQGIPFSNAARPDRATPPKVDRDNFYGRLNTDFRENSQKTATALFEHDFAGGLTLRNTTRYGTTLNHYLLSRPTFDNCTATSGAPCTTEGSDAEFRRGSRAWWRSSKTLVNQTDLSGSFSTGAVRHRFIGGLELGNERIYNRAVSGAPGNEQDSLHHPNPYGLYDYDLAYGPRTAAGRIRSSSLYLFDTMDLSDRLSANAGLRREWFRVSNATTHRSDAFWNYELGLVYTLAENGTAYLSYGTSSNPAGENLGQGGGADGVAGGATIRDLKPERSRSWELGTKWDVFDHGLSLTAAVFETKKTDARSSDPLTGEVTLAGSNRVRGLELGAAGAITPRWNLWAGYTFMDPKVLHYRNGNNVFDGEQMKFIARHSASLWTTYRLLPDWTLGGGVTYVGKRFANDANTLYLPSSTRYDAMLKYQATRRFDLQLNVNNIGDDPLYDASHVGLFATVGAGRSYMLTGTYRFD